MTTTEYAALAKRAKEHVGVRPLSPTDAYVFVLPGLRLSAEEVAALAVGRPDPPAHVTVPNYSTPTRLAGGGARYRVVIGRPVKRAEPEAAA